MRVQRWRFAEDYADSTLNQAYLDTAVNVSRYQHPSIVGVAAIDPGLTQSVNGVTLEGGTLPADIQDRVVTGTGWAAVETVETTTGATDALAVSTTARQVVFSLTGILEAGNLYDTGATGVQAGAIHRGGIVTVSVDGTVLVTVDLYQTAYQGTLYLDGQRHTIRIARTGTYNRAIDPGTVAADPPMLGIVGVDFLYGTGTGNPAWHSAVLDTGSDDTLWQNVEWIQNVTPAYVTLAVGNTPNPVLDASQWQVGVLSSFQLSPLSTGETLGTAGLAALPVPRGRYGRLGILFPPSATVPPLVRDIALYTWVPAIDPTLMTKIALGQDWAPDPVFLALLGALTALALDSRTTALDYWDALTPAGAVDAALQSYGADLGLPQYTGEGPLSYRRRILASMSMATEAGSSAALATQVALLAGFAPSAIAVTTPGGPYTYTVTIPPPVGAPAAYPGLPGLGVAYAQTIITSLIQLLDPVTNAPTIVFG